jgi:hypothetical protein
LKIAISGTHCSGKSTLIDEFLLAHTDFAHEPEPYVVLQDDFDEVFAAESSADDFYRQLEFNIERLRSHPPGERVIYERCPVDFLAYMLALEDLRRDAEATQIVERSLKMLKDAIKLLDLIVFLPLDDLDCDVMPEAEDSELRIAVDKRLVCILCDDDFDFFNSLHPAILEVRGSTAQRLLKLESALNSHTRSL